MIEKVKNFFTTMASAAVFLYVTGYMAEYAHAGMLGISLVEPFREYYLITGGTFILSTLYALYAVIFSYFPYLLPFVVVTVAILLYDLALKPGAPVSRGYVVFMGLLAAGLLFVAVPVFTSPFAFSDFLLNDAKPAGQGDFLLKGFHVFTSELWTWIRNGGVVNRQKLALFYVLSICSAGVSAVMLYSMVKRWKGWKPVAPEPPAVEGVPRPRSLSARVLTAVPGLPRFLFGILIVLVVFVVVVQVVSIPVNYGILIKSNDYPVVSVLMTKEGGELVEGRAPGSECKLWLLRESSGELLLCAAYIPVGKNDFRYKLFAVKKERVEKIEVSAKEFIFEHK